MEDRELPHDLILDTEYETEGIRTAEEPAAAVFAKIRPADYGALLKVALEDHALAVVNGFPSMSSPVRQCSTTSTSTRAKAHRHRRRIRREPPGRGES